MQDFGKQLQTVAWRSHREGTGLYLHGPNGIGKTHMAMALLRMAQEDGQRVDAILMADLLSYVRRGYDPATQTVPDDVLAGYAECPLLVLDDLGAERVTPWVEETLYRLLQRRELERDRLRTIITSNLTLSELADFYPTSGDRIASRIAGMCRVHGWMGTDRRLAIAQSKVLGATT